MEEVRREGGARAGVRGGGGTDKLTLPMQERTGLPRSTANPEDTLATERTPWMSLLLLVGMVIAVGWAWNHVALWPIKVLVVMFHELGHAVATWATGGTVLEIGLSPYEGGHTISKGGWRVVILNAGYLGSLIAGVGLLAAGRRALPSRVVTIGIGVLLLVVSAIFVLWPNLLSGALFTSSDVWFSLGFTGVVGVAMIVLGALIPGFVLKWGVRGLGAFSVLYALVDVWSDVFARALDVTVRSDAVMLAELTGVPALVWGAVWVIAGLGLLVLLRKWLV